jgi:hypothetical protein
MGGANPTATENYRKFQNQLPAQKVGYGVGGEMLAKPASTPEAKASETPNFFGRDASKPLSADEQVEMELRKSELGKK